MHSRIEGARTDEGSGTREAVIPVPSSTKPPAKVEAARVIDITANPHDVIVVKQGEGIDVMIFRPMIHLAPLVVDDVQVRPRVFRQNLFHSRTVGTDNVTLAVNPSTRLRLSVLIDPKFVGQCRPIQAVVALQDHITATAVEAVEARNQGAIDVVHEHLAIAGCRRRSVEHLSGTFDKMIVVGAHFDSFGLQKRQGRFKRIVRVKATRRTGDDLGFRRRRYGGDVRCIHRIGFHGNGLILFC